MKHFNTKEIKNCKIWKKFEKKKLINLKKC